MDRKSLESKTSEAQLTFLLQILMIDVCGNDGLMVALIILLCVCVGLLEVA